MFLASVLAGFNVRVGRPTCLPLEIRTVRTLCNRLNGKNEVGRSVCNSLSGTAPKALTLT